MYEEKKTDPSGNVYEVEEVKEGERKREGGRERERREGGERERD